MNSESDRFIACGMYAFTLEQRSAWQQLFDRFLESSGIAPGKVGIRFEHDPDLLRAPGLWFGHTCGYPLMTAQQEYVTPFCLPLFNVSGTEGSLYSSVIIVAEDAPIESLEDAREGVCAVNNPDSNSGMNVLRHALARMARGERFFSRVDITGGHQASLESVANGTADIAAIDCVSYRLIADAMPALAERVRVIANTVKTGGLPLVMPRADFADSSAERICANLNRALERCDPEVETVLHLTGFAEAGLDHYASILAVAQYAIDLGYPELA